MSNYSKTTDFAAKDSLPSGDSGKIIRGSEFETEFDNISTAIATKADAADPTFTGTVTIDGLTVNGNTVLGNAATDTVTVTADIASNLIPSADDTYNLGASGAEWNDLFIDGTANIDSLVADTADINGGTIDGVTIGGSSAGAITGTAISGTSFASTGNMTFGDNNKAIFGASNDLQIYHDGTDTQIREVGAGNLKIITDGAAVQIQSTTENMIVAQPNDAVTLFYDSSQKLATTATGVDVTGTVTADGLTSDGGISIDESGTAISITNGDGLTQLGKFHGESSNGFVIEGKSNNNLTLRTKANTLGEGIKFQDSAGDNMMFIDGTTGDVSLYEDTGTTAKFLWDASEESLRVPLGLYSNSINAFPSTGYAAVYSTGTGGSAPFNEAGHLVLQARSSGALRDIIFATGNGAAERVRIDASGNVGIGTDSPGSILDISAGTNLNAAFTQLSMDNFTNDGIGITFSRTSSDADLSALGIVDTDKLGLFSRQGLIFGTGGSNAYGQVTEAMRIDSSGNVGVGIDNVGAKLDVLVGGNERLLFTTLGSDPFIGSVNAANSAYKALQLNGSDIKLLTNGSEAMRIDSSGNLLVGKTTTGGAYVGVEARADGFLLATRDGDTAGYFNRKNSDGAIVDFRKDGFTVGSIGTYSSDLCAGSGDTGVRFAQGLDAVLPSNIASSANRDAAIDLGYPSVRFKDLYLSGGAYLGGTAAANKLDDYEEGTFTPAINTTNTDINIGYASQSGLYTKVGDIVQIQIFIQVNSVTSQGTGNLKITGLPFTTASLQECRFSTTNTRALEGNLDANKYVVRAGSTELVITNASDTTAVATGSVTASVAYFIVSGVYRTSA